MKAISVHEFGPPEVLRYENVAEPSVAVGRLLVRSILAGVNFVDVHLRTGRRGGVVPFTPGDDGVGVIEAVGPGVTGFAVGQRIAWTAGAGSYAERVSVPAATAAILPDAFPDDYGLILAQGLTAHYLSHDLLPERVRRGGVALVHAAAGGVGQLLCKLLKLRGAHVIGLVSTTNKVEAARHAGADAVLVTAASGFADRVRALTDQRGVDIVFDSVGRPTFDESLKSLAPHGKFVLYGTSGGEVGPVDLMIFAAAGAVSFVRPGLLHFIADRTVFEARVADLFRWLADGLLDFELGAVFNLSEARHAHLLLESRQSTGKIALRL